MKATRRTTIVQSHAQFATQYAAAERLGVSWAQFARDVLTERARLVLLERRKLPTSCLSSLALGQRVYLVRGDVEHAARVVRLLEGRRVVVQREDIDAAHILPCSEFEVYE